MVSLGTQVSTTDCRKHSNCLTCPFPTGECLAHVPASIWGRRPHGRSRSFVRVDYDAYSMLKQQGLTQQEIARKLGVCRQTLSRRLKWRVMPDKGDVLALIKEGKTQKQTCRELRISPKTLRRHGLWPKRWHKRKLEAA